MKNVAASDSRLSRTVAVTLQGVSFTDLCPLKGTAFRGIFDDYIRTAQAKRWVSLSVLSERVRMATYQGRLERMGSG